MIFDSLVENNTRWVVSNIPPELDNIEECEGNPFEYAISIVYENQIMCNILEQEMIVEECQKLQESQIIHEDNIITKFFTGIKNIIKKIWEKICAFFKKIFSFFKREKSTVKKEVETSKKIEIPTIDEHKFDNAIKELKKNVETSKELNKIAEKINTLTKSWPDPLNLIYTEYGMDNVDRLIKGFNAQFMGISIKIDKKLMDSATDVQECINGFKFNWNKQWNEKMKSIIHPYDDSKSFEENVNNYFGRTIKVKVAGTKQDREHLWNVINYYSEAQGILRTVFDNTKKQIEDAEKYVKEAQATLLKKEQESSNSNTAIMTYNPNLPMKVNKVQEFEIYKGILEHMASFYPKLLNMVTTVDTVSAKRMIRTLNGARSCLAKVDNYLKKLKEIENQLVELKKQLKQLS